jgi:hypothetical protein
MAERTIITAVTEQRLVTLDTFPPGPTPQGVESVTAVSVIKEQVVTVGKAIIIEQIVEDLDS